MILVINCGSQSIKWEAFDNGLNLISAGKGEYFDLKKAGPVIRAEFDRIRKKFSKIDFVGHRVVWGGEFFEPLLVKKPVLGKLEKFSGHAPLHNPFEILAIKIAQKSFKEAKQVAVFDSGFFKDLPEVARRYPLLESLNKKYSIRRYGFHGISHKYLTFEAAKILKKPVSQTNLITLHLGGGASITAIKAGKPIDTSMGFTPLEGLLMTTRSGDIDAGLVLFLVKKLGLKRTERILSVEGGLRAISGYSDFRNVLKSKKKSSKLAFDMFVYRIRKYLMAYYGVLEGEVDAIVFSGSIGAGNAKTKNAVLKNLPISKKIKILTIKTNESYQIAKEIKEKWRL